VTVCAGFDPQPACWICGGTRLVPIHQLIFELSEYRAQDPELAAYTGSRVSLCRCRRCGFAQPEALPAMPKYFDRMYDQRWSDDWIAREFEADCKDGIFHGILDALAERLDVRRRRLLDVGAHAGRFVAVAGRAGWQAEGLELNPKTAAYAARRTGARIRQTNVHDANLERRAYDAVTITDVLEHIPHPLDVLSRAGDLLSSDGWIAVKVPSGPSQLVKETWRGRLRSGYRPTIADNLVHVSHFSAGSLRLALERAGFTSITIEPGAPELPADGGARGAIARASRRAVHAAARAIPASVYTPLALNLQAYARRP
jgi:SAM-dependent methyltransferase